MMTCDTSLIRSGDDDKFGAHIAVPCAPGAGPRRRAGMVPAEMLSSSLINPARSLPVRDGTACQRRCCLSFS